MPKKSFLLKWCVLPAFCFWTANHAFAATGSHKVEVHNAAAAREVEARGGTLIADYGAFRLYQVPDVNNIPYTANVRDNYNLVRLNAGTIDTSQKEIQAARKKASAFAGRKLHLVQFAGPVQGAWRKSLQDAGVQIVSYIPHNTYLVYGDSAAIARVQAMATTAPHIQWDGQYADDYKIHPRARTIDKQGNPRQPGADRFAIQLVADPAANADTLKLIGQLALGPIQHERQVLNLVDIIARFSPNSLNQIASRPDVISIQPSASPRKVCERQDQIVAGNLSGSSPAGPGYLAWLQSKGFSPGQFTNFVVDVTDSGIDNGTTAPNHFGLYTSGNINGGASRVVYNILEGTPNPGSTLQGCDGHGNLNAHIVMGYDNGNGFPFADNSGFHYGLGVCPFVSVGSSVIFDPDNGTNPDDTTVIFNAYEHGARISNNSWGDSDSTDDGTYNVDSYEYDSLVRNADPSNPTNQGMVIVFAAGNDGPGADSISPPGTSKNVITVGAAENVQAFGGADSSEVGDDQADDANAMVDFSSRGPCADGRSKPDLVAPGTHVSGGVPQAQNPSADGTALSCFINDGDGVSGGPTNSASFPFFPAHQQFYTASSGTSHSTPCVTGGCALVWQYFVNNTLLGTNPPSPAMVKAFLMNSARYMTSTGANDTLWSQNQGMGEMDLGLAFDGTERLLRDQNAADTFTATGQSRVFAGVVGDATKPFRVTLAWTDAPGSTSGAAYNNDLDLTVTIGGVTYKGNNFSGAYSIPGGNADNMNNVESVFLPAGVSGNFTVTVTAANINSVGVPNSANELNQDFALVIYNTGAAATIAAAGYTITNGTCGTSAIYPGEQVTVDLSLQNFGGTTTTNLIATPLAYLLYRGVDASGSNLPPAQLADFLAGNGVALPGGPMSYGAIPAGGAASQPFSFIADGTCGDMIDIILQLQDGAVNLGTVDFAVQLGLPLDLTNFSQNFDGTSGQLPTGWSTITSSGQIAGWTLENTNSDTAPYAAYTPDSPIAGSNALFSPVIALSNGLNQLVFRNDYNLEPEFDGGVLNISIGRGPFVDILAAGGSFVVGGYNGTITDVGDTNPGTASPVEGRQGWTASSDGFITTIVDLPASASGSTAQFEWVCGTDKGNNAILPGPSGWWIDSVAIMQPTFDCTNCQIASATNVTIAFPTNHYDIIANSSAVVVAGQGPAGQTVTITDNDSVNTNVTVDANGIYTGLVTLNYGTNILTASVGGTNVSAPVLVYVGVGPPVLDAASVVNTNATVSGTGIPGATVDLYEDGATNGSPLAIFTVNSTGTFSGTVTLPVGVVTLEATQSFASQTSGSSTPVTVTVVLYGPATITSPVTGFVTNKPTIKIAGTGIPGATIGINDITAAGTNTLAATTVNQKGAFSYNVKLSDGTNILFATQNGSNSPDSAPVVVVDYLSPHVLVQPQNQTNFLKGRVTFSAQVMGASPIKFTWQRNGATIRGAGGQKLTLNNLTSSDAGEYVLIASNAYGKTNTQAATLSLVNNPFPDLTGNYYGLFSTRVGQFASAGFISLDLTSLGKFTAKLLNAGQSYSFSGAFSGVGWWSNNIARAKSEPPLSIVLNLDTLNGTGEILGSVSAGTNWAASLLANHAAYSSAAPFSSHGKYTVVFGNTNRGLQSPGGDGYAIVTISSSGVVTTSGLLPDNTPFVASPIGLSKGSTWPLYVPLYGHAGILEGWMGFANSGPTVTNVTNLGPANLSGTNMVWIRTNADGKMYTHGFTNTLAAVGSSFLSENNPAEIGISGMDVFLTGGDLTIAESNSVVPLSNGKFTINGAGIPGLSLSLNPSTGALKGSFDDPASTKPGTIRGVLLQDQSSGAGFFLSGTNSGLFLLTP